MWFVAVTFDFLRKSFFDNIYYHIMYQVLKALANLLTSMGLDSHPLIIEVGNPLACYDRLHE